MPVLSTHISIFSRIDHWVSEHVMRCCNGNGGHYFMISLGRFQATTKKGLVGIINANMRVAVGARNWPRFTLLHILR